MCWFAQFQMPLLSAALTELGLPASEDPDSLQEEMMRNRMYTVAKVELGQCTTQQQDPYACPLPHTTNSHNTGPLV